ncbi:hypothetical protein U9M48_023847 [Paspalum notatum var. saurae]|uniref:Uncharacterized protein n=1 Tax=Paspalum notatum var. saurae TaxID=547442 RepID=A0AAQ3WWH6_PASNO
MMVKDFRCETLFERYLRMRLC